MRVATKTVRPEAAVPARSLPTGELNRATDLLLDAATDRSDPACVAPAAAVAEFAGWCALDLRVGEEGLERVATATAEDLDPRAVGSALVHFERPDPLMLTRLELAQAPIRVEDPDWLPEHRAVAAGVGGAGHLRGSIIALIPLAEHDLAGDLWFMAELGRRLDQMIELCAPRQLG